MDHKRDTPRSVWGGNYPPDEAIGGDTRSIGLFFGRQRERIARRVPHPAIPSLETLRAFRRSLAQIGLSRRERPSTDAHPPVGDPTDFDLCAIQFVEETCLEGDRVPTLDADVNLSLLLRDLDESEYPFWRGAVITEARDGSARGLANRLSDASSHWLPKHLGFDPDDPPTHSTLSRHWRYDEPMETAIAELGHRARYAALWAGAEFPEDLRQEGWGIEEILSSEPALDEKLVAIKHLVEEGVAVMSPHLSFGRNPDAPAFKLPPAAFIAFFAHLALEDSYAQTGQRTMQWLDLPAPVPAADTVHKYVRELTVEDVDKMFGYATAALLHQEDEASQPDPTEEALEPPVHLAYDTTKVEWYGDQSAEWTSGVLPRDNTASAWVFAILSIVGRDMSYVLGTLPLRNQTEIGEYLQRFLRRAIGVYNLEIGRVYLDSELYTQKAVEALREADVDFLIQAKDKGDISDLLKSATKGEIEFKESVSFGDFSLATRPNAFAWPIPEEETGSKDRDYPHKAFLTDMDIEEHDLEGLGRVFRDRWGVETSIREIKNRFHARCRASEPNARAFYFMMATVLYNLSQYVDNRLEERLYADDIEWSGQELLHAVREVNPDGVPNWGDAYDPEEADEWTSLR